MTSSTQNCRPDAVIIGGGLIGLSAALALRYTGMDVTVLETTTIARHASSASAGGVRSLNRDPAEIALARAALPVWAALDKQLGYPCGFKASGQIRVAENADAFDALAARAALTRNLGHHHERLIGANELKFRLPELADNCAGALLVDDDGYADSLMTVHAYRQACINAGVSLQEGVRVSAINSDNAGLQLHCVTQGDTLPKEPRWLEYRCRHCINAAGAWGNVLSTSVGEPVPLRAAALQMAVTEPIPKFVSDVVGCHARKLSLKQTAAGALVIGGGYEGFVHDDQHVGLRGTLNHTLAAENLANAAALFPHLQHVRVVRQWAGIEGMIIDSLPVLGQSHRVPGLIHAFGFSAHGFALVPVIGPLVAAIAQGRDDHLSIDAFSIDRFEKNRSNQAA